METILNEFEEFLQLTFTEYSIPSSGGSLSGMLGKLKNTQIATKELDEKAIIKANELLNRENENIDKELLKEKLQEIGAIKIKQFIINSFNGN